MIKKIKDYIFGVKQKEDNSIPKAKILKLLIIPHAQSEIIEPGEWVEIDTEGTDLKEYYDQFNLKQHSYHALKEAKRQIDEEIAIRDLPINEDEKCRDNEMLQPPSLYICDKCGGVCTSEQREYDKPLPAAIVVALLEGDRICDHCIAQAQCEDEELELCKSLELAKHRIKMPGLSEIFDFYKKEQPSDESVQLEEETDPYKINTNEGINIAIGPNSLGIAKPHTFDCRELPALFSEYEDEDIPSYQKKTSRDKSTPKKKRAFPVRRKSHAMDGVKSKKK